MLRRLMTVALGALVAAWSVGAVVAQPAAAAVPTPPFNQCPPLGLDTSCGILLVINANGSITVLQDSTQPPYDGIEDTLIGVLNQSSQSVPSLHLSSTVAPGGEPPFGFDGDGQEFFTGVDNGPTGYEGPNTSFSNIAVDLLSGDVNFTGGLAAGASAWFTLEGAISAEDLVFNNPPDCSAAVASITSLWPPNHQLVPITINGVTDPDGDVVTVTATAVTQDEPTNGLGDGDTAPDAVIASGAASVRAERSGTGDGRVYAIAFTATDPSGATCSGSVTVGVPHDQGRGRVPVDSGQNFNSLI